MYLFISSFILFLLGLLRYLFRSVFLLSFGISLVIYVFLSFVSSLFLSLVLPSFHSLVFFCFVIYLLRAFFPSSFRHSCISDVFIPSALSLFL